MIHLDQFQNSDFVRGASRTTEALWWLARSLLFAPWFPVPSSIKVAVLRLFGARIGRGVVIRSRVNITFPWRFECGDHVWIGAEVMILSLDQVRLGSHVCISQRAFLCTGSHDHRQERFDLITRKIEIGDGCWVGAQAFLGPGVVMGKGSVVAAGAVVIKDVDAGIVVGGNPAKPLQGKEGGIP
jgi:putative colanic acid biosynthesis acetyltransferase WcaF